MLLLTAVVYLQNIISLVKGSLSVIEGGILTKGEMLKNVSL